MAYTLKQNPGSLVITLANEPDSTIMIDLMSSLDKAISLLDDTSEQVFLVIDLRRVTLNMDDHIRLSSTLALGPNPVVHHPRVIETLFVTADPATRMATAGLASPAFGEVRLSQFDSLAEALAYGAERLAGPVRA